MPVWLQRIYDPIGKQLLGEVPTDPSTKRTVRSPNRYVSCARCNVRQPEPMHFFRVCPDDPDTLAEYDANVHEFERFPTSEARSAGANSVRSGHIVPPNTGRGDGSSSSRSPSYDPYAHAHIVYDFPGVLAMSQARQHYIDEGIDRRAEFYQSGSAADVRAEDGGDRKISPTSPEGRLRRRVTPVFCVVLHRVIVYYYGGGSFFFKNDILLMMRFLLMLANRRN